MTLIPEETRVVVMVRPAALLAAEPTARVVRAVFSDEQLDRFRMRTGVDPRTLEELVIGIHPDGHVVLVRGPIDAVFVVREAGERMAPLESSTDEPRARRAGFLGPRRTELAALGDDTLMWVEGTPQLAAAVLAAADRPEAGRNPALAELSASLEEHRDAPLIVAVPHPLGLPVDTGIGMLLAREETMVVILRAEDDGLRLEAELRGEFPPDSQSNFRTFVESVAETDLGAALALEEALPSLRIQAAEDYVRLTVRVAPGALARGLRILLVAEIEEMLEPRE